MSYKLKEGGVLRLGDGAHITDDPANRDWQEYQNWLADGNTPQAADPPPPPPTLDQIYDQTMQNQRVLKAVVIAINKGTIVPGANATNAALKAAVKAEM